VASRRPERCSGLPLLPFVLRRFRILQILDRVVFRLYFRILQAWNSYEAIVITHPLLFAYVRGLTAIYYDCQDDNEAFYLEHSPLRKDISGAHKLLLRDGVGTVFSSTTLAKRYGNDTKRCVVIRNGHDDVPSVINRQDSITRGAVKRVFYFGTISSWFDFDLLLASMAVLKDLEYHLIGPADVPIPSHANIIAYGALGHQEMLDAAKLADAFVMPFRVTPLIEAVDPVKLYEYLAFGRCVIVPRYDEMKHFEDYVYSYSNGPEYVSLMKQLTEDVLSPRNMNTIKDFLDGSRWSIRAKELHQFLG